MWSKSLGPEWDGEAEAASSLQNSLGSYVSDVRSTQPKGTGLGGSVESSPGGVWVVEGMIGTSR